MADLWGGKSLLFGTLQEGNSNQSLKAQPRKGNAEMHEMERLQGMGKKEIYMGMKMICQLSWTGDLLFIPSSFLLSSL